MLTAGEQRFIYQVDLYKGEIAQLESINDKDHPLQIHIAAYVMRHAMGVNLLAHLGIGKRVTYRVTRKEKKYAERLKTMLDLYEYELLPLTNNLRLRSLQTWALRWREIFLYVTLLKDKLLGKKLNFEKQLVPLPSEPLPSRALPSRAKHVNEPQSRAA